MTELEDNGLFAALDPSPVSAPLMPELSPSGRRTPRFVSGRELSTGRPAIAVQVMQASHVPIVAQICVDEGLAAILTIDTRTDPMRAIHDQVAAFSGITRDVTHTLVDANRYAGSGRVSGVHDLDVGWIDAQLNLGFEYALTNSPYIPEGDTAAVESILDQVVRMRRPVIAALPIANWWLRNKRGRKFLLERINRAGVPVALMVEHAKDPMGVVDVVRGLVAILAAEPPVLLLRSDLSAIGACAHGAAGGAIGTTTGLRHIFPKPKPDQKGGGYRDPQVAVFVPQLLAYMSVSKAADLAQYTGIDKFMECTCYRCNGLGVEWITDETTAFDHSLRAITDFAATRLGTRKTPQEMKDGWSLALETAQHKHLDIEGTTGVEVGIPKFFGAWRPVYGAGE